MYLVFQLKSHAYLYESMPQQMVDAEAAPGPGGRWLDSSTTVVAYNLTLGDPSPPSGPMSHVPHGIRRIASLPDRLLQQQRSRPPGQMALGNGSVGRKRPGKKEKSTYLTKWSSIFLLLVTTGLVAFHAELLVSSMEDVTSTASVSETFIGLIVLPLVGNAAEHVTAITVALRNKMNLAIGVAIGSSIQIALLITPFVVLLGWAMGEDMTLYLTLFETVCLFLSAFMVGFLVLDGRSNYLEGAVLCAVWGIVAVVAWFYPKVGEVSLWAKSHS